MHVCEEAVKKLKVVSSAFHPHAKKTYACCEKQIGSHVCAYTVNQYGQYIAFSTELIILLLLLLCICSMH